MDHLQLLADETALSAVAGILKELARTTYLLATEAPLARALRVITPARSFRKSARERTDQSPLDSLDITNTISSSAWRLALGGTSRGRRRIKLLLFKRLCLICTKPASELTDITRSSGKSLEALAGLQRRSLLQSKL